ncbi:MAG: dephospho-CoA kinase [Candidatus Omnitrophica bacterium]|nr:dephospho-CoA kinase [Candidatus Omnitrophota bacterium]
MKVIGVTGTVGSGKSTVCGFFKELGAHVIDADVIGHHILAPHTPTWKKIIDAFGRQVTQEDGSIDRRVLSDIVFFDSSALETLCAITHPDIIREIDAEIERISREDPGGCIVIDAPLLIESGLHTRMDAVVVVEASFEDQIARKRHETGLSEKDIRARLKAQLSIDEKRRHADFIISNTGSFDETKKQVKEIWQRMFRSR